MDTKATSATHHIVPLRVYLGVAAMLFVLTGVTVGVSFIPLGGWNVVVALIVASIKATFVALIFMHLLYDKKIYLTIFVTAILFLAVY
jgi:cytochrome c oxidase subunit 4